MRIGHGYDVHRLVEGRPLILGGVTIEHETGLLGHSDADVLLHAISDALLGAAALGDIGRLFPDTDDAYLAFAKLVPDARAAYAHSFHAACEEVFNGHCEYCILPIENAVEGELIGFAKLIAQFDLKVAAACDIAGADASRRTRFALLRRNVLPFFTPDSEKNGFFRFSLPAQSAPFIADVLSAASFFELAFLSANTLPIDKEGAMACFNLTFDIRGGDLYPFLLYLATIAPQYTPIGIYSQIQQKGR